MSWYFAAFMIVFGVVFLCFGRSMARRGVFYYNDVNYHWNVKRSENPNTFRVLLGLVYVFGIGWIVMPLAYFYFDGRDSSDAPMQTHQNMVEQDEIAKSVQEQLNRRAQDIQDGKH